MKKLLMLILLVGCSSNTEREPYRTTGAPGGAGELIDTGGQGGDPSAGGGVGGSEVTSCATSSTCAGPNSCPSGQVCVPDEPGSEFGECEEAIEVTAGHHCNGPPEVCEAGFFCDVDAGVCLLRRGEEGCSVDQPCGQGTFCNESNFCQVCAD